MEAVVDERIEEESGSKPAGGALREAAPDLAVL
jgi:hypothetical protein